MDDRDFNELAGRIEGVTRALMLLAAMMEDRHMINGPRYCAALHRSADALDFPGPSLASAQQTMGDIARELESARTVRQALAATS